MKELTAEEFLKKKKSTLKKIWLLTCLFFASVLSSSFLIFLTSSVNLIDILQFVIPIISILLPVCFIIFIIFIWNEISQIKRNNIFSVDEKEEIEFEGWFSIFINSIFFVLSFFFCIYLSGSYRNAIVNETVTVEHDWKKYKVIYKTLNFEGENKYLKVGGKKYEEIHKRNKNHFNELTLDDHKETVKGLLDTTEKRGVIIKKNEMWKLESILSVIVSEK